MSVRSLAAEQLGLEIGRVSRRLGEMVRRQRSEGRTALGDAVAGMVIEEGEAEGLARSVEARWFGRAEEIPSFLHPDDAALRVGESEVEHPIHAIAEAFELTPAEHDGFILCLGVELDRDLARLVAYLNDHVERSAPTLGLVSRLGGGPVTDLATRPWIREGLVRTAMQRGPMHAWELRVSVGMVRHILGDRLVEPGTDVRCEPPEAIDRLELDPDVGAAAHLVAERIRQEERCRPVWVFARDGAVAVAVAIAAKSGATAVVVERAQEPNRLLAGRCLVRLHAPAVMVVDASPASPATSPRARMEPGDEDAEPPAAQSEDSLVDALRNLPFPVLVASPAATPPGGVGATLEVPTASRRRRIRLWHRLGAADGVDEALAVHLGARFRYGPDGIARALEVSRQAHVTTAAPWRQRLLAACRALGRSGMGALADRLPTPFDASDLVVVDLARRELDLAIAWVRQAHVVLDDWGFGAARSAGRGVAILLCGPPGTGKTMTAQVLARELDLDVFRVDLSRVVSKYIGETEKKLSAVFDAAEAANAVLFFDEADALFGKRSEVKDAHDRYANIEVGYLLQRMETYEGVIVLATNRARDLDEAFTRRFQFRIELAAPGPAERLELWRRSIPPDAPTSGDLALEQLAQRFEMSGGEIKNAVLAAATMAASESTPIANRHLVAAAVRETRKAGRMVRG